MNIFMFSRNLSVPGFVRRFFVSYAHISEAYAVRTVMNPGATGGKRPQRQVQERLREDIISLKEDILMKEQMTTTGNSAGISGKRAQTQFRKYLLERNMSERTITAYCYALKQFYGLYSQLTDKNLQLYKVFLIERYKPQTVNLRLRAMNCFVRYRESSLCPVSMVHVQQKGFLEQIISQTDYEFLKQRLWEDGEYNYYFLIRLMAATGVRISELVLFDVEDVKRDTGIFILKGISCAGFTFRLFCERHLRNGPGFPSVRMGSYF